MPRPHPGSIRGSRRCRRWLPVSGRAWQSLVRVRTGSSRPIARECPKCAARPALRHCARAERAVSRRTMQPTVGAVHPQSGRAPRPGACSLRSNVYRRRVWLHAR
eukprot:scaffold28166_cov112-Isochrysis_galbana.AAC.3